MSQRARAATRQVPHVGRRLYLISHPPSTIVDEMSDVKTMSMVVSRCSKPKASRLRSGLAGRCVFVEVVVPVGAAAERLVLALAAPAEVEVFT